MSANDVGDGRSVLAVVDDELMLTRLGFDNDHHEQRCLLTVSLSDGASSFF